jgi:hypothetical protein
MNANLSEINFQHVDNFPSCQLVACRYSLDTDRLQVTRPTGVTPEQSATVARIVANSRLAACKPADAPKTADEANDATASSVETRWKAVVATRE